MEDKDIMRLTNEINESHRQDIKELSVKMDRFMDCIATNNERIKGNEIS